MAYVSASLKRALNTTSRKESYSLVNESENEIETIFTLKTIATIWKCVDHYNSEFKFYKGKCKHRFGTEKVNFIHIKTGKVKISFTFDKEKGYVYSA